MDLLVSEAFMRCSQKRGPGGFYPKRTMAPLQKKIQEKTQITLNTLKSVSHK